MKPSPPPTPIARAVGEFFGHLWRAVKSDVRRMSSPMTPTSGRPAAEVRREVREQVVQTDRGPVVLRRTVIDEIQPAAGADPASDRRMGPDRP